MAPLAELTTTRELTIALAGNPNSGKTSVFNHLTGAHQHVGNWPGVTVERKEGFRQGPNGRVKIVDLPGAYSLTAHSLDERVAREAILSGDADVVIAVVDASNLERNLYLVVQLIELGVPMVVALNMSDIAHDRGFIINVDKLSSLLDVQVVPTCAHVGEGIEPLLAAAVACAAKGDTPRPLRYGRQVDEAIDTVGEALLQAPGLLDEHPLTWLAIALLTGEVPPSVDAKRDDPEVQRVLATASACAQHLEDVIRDTAEQAVINGRYGAIAGIYREAVSEPADPAASPSDRIDRVLLDRIWGLPILLAVVAAVFQLTFAIGAYPSEWIDRGIAALAGYLGDSLAEGPLSSLLIDGAIGGVGGVLVFVPQIFILFAAIAILEDSGYMARAAFLMDRIMHAMRLHGKAFIPMVMGFGCNVPAIMATRTLESHRDRLVTILVVPLMTCSARLPVYALIAGALFGARAGLVIFSMYSLGIILAALVARVLGSHIVRGEEDPFVMELPPYHRPTPKGIVIHTWERGRLFVQRAGTVILAGSIIMWALSALPWGVEVGGEDSYVGRLGKVAEPLVRPLGMQWQEGVALAAGFVAKEIVVSTMGVLYGVGAEADTSDLGRAIAASHLTPLSGYAFMAFVLIYAPCLAAVAAVRRETSSWRWTLASVGYQTGLAWLVAFLIYQGGRLIGLE